MLQNCICFASLVLREFQDLCYSTIKNDKLRKPKTLIPNAIIKIKTNPR